MSTQNPQYMLKKLVPKWSLLKQTSPEKYGTGLVGLCKNAWGEASEVVFAGFIFIGSGIGLYMINEQDKRTKYYSNKPYKNYYTVYRPDDPRIDALRKEWYENGAPPMTSARVKST